MKTINVLLLSTLSIYAGLLHANTLNQRWGSWLSAIHRNSFNTTSKCKWNYILMGQLRLLNRSQVYHQTLLTAGVYYDCSSHWQFGGGYRFFNENSLPSRSHIDENRLYQEVLWKTPLDKNKMGIRFLTLLEERFRKAQRQMGLRLRERLTWKRSLSKKSNFILAEEVLISLVRPAWAGPSTFDQNRFFCGFSSSLGSKSSIIYGYLNQYLVRNPKNVMNHILFVSFTF